jgi:hypothetical protein
MRPSQVGPGNEGPLTDIGKTIGHVPQESPMLLCSKTLRDLGGILSILPEFLTTHRPHLFVASTEEFAGVNDNIVII